MASSSLGSKRSIVSSKASKLGSEFVEGLKTAGHQIKDTAVSAKDIAFPSSKKPQKHKDSMQQYIDEQLNNMQVTPNSEEIGYNATDAYNNPEVSECFDKIVHSMYVLERINKVMLNSAIVHDNDKLNGCHADQAVHGKILTKAIKDFAESHSWGVFGDENINESFKKCLEAKKLREEEDRNNELQFDLNYTKKILLRSGIAIAGGVAIGGTTFGLIKLGSYLTLKSMPPFPPTVAPPIEAIAAGGGIGTLSIVLIVALIFVVAILIIGLIGLHMDMKRHQKSLEKNKESTEKIKIISDVVDKVQKMSDGTEIDSKTYSGTVDFVGNVFSDATKDIKRYETIPGLVNIDSIKAQNEARQLKNSNIEKYKKSKEIEIKSITEKVEIFRDIINKSDFCKQNEDLKNIINNKIDVFSRELIAQFESGDITDSKKEEYIKKLPSYVYTQILKNIENNQITDEYRGIHDVLKEQFYTELEELAQKAALAQKEEIELSQEQLQESHTPLDFDAISDLDDIMLAHSEQKELNTVAQSEQEGFDIGMLSGDAIEKEESITGSVDSSIDNEDKSRDINIADANIRNHTSDRSTTTDDNELNSDKPGSLLTDIDASSVVSEERLHSKQ